jgi:hypothetical protein
MDVVDLRGCSQVANDLGALMVAIVSGWFHEIGFYWALGRLTTRPVDPATAIDAMIEIVPARRTKIQCLVDVSDYSLHGNGDSESDDLAIVRIILTC